jgi:RNA polymerase sigma-70 factor, ECF subfamily
MRRALGVSLAMSSTKLKKNVARFRVSLHVRSMSRDRLHERGASTTHSSDLVDRLRSGDTGALAELMRTYAESLIAYAASITQSDDVAQDVVQDVFIRVWNRREALSNDRSIAPYLFHAVRNAAFDVRRAERRAELREATAAKEGIGIPSATASPSGSIEVDELSRAAVRVIASLPPACREVFLLTRRGELTYAESAAVLGVSVSTVKTQMARAVAALARALAPVLILEMTRALFRVA